MSYAQLGALITPASVGSPGEDGGAVELWISGGGGEGSLSNIPSDGLASRTTADLSVQWKVSPGMVAEEKKTALYERPRRVTWD